jgi:cytochrome c biogenesis protein CcmG, thiol:disulfide interchange protein DsbE
MTEPISTQAPKPRTASGARFLVPLLTFFALAGLLYYGLSLDPRKVPSPLVDKPAPAFDLESLTEPGKRLNGDILKGKVSLVNVWASWCPSCRQEHGELVRIARNAGVQMIGFNWKDERPAALEMLQAFGNPYALTLFDPDNRAGIDWGVYGAPETFVVDGDGIIRHKRIGPIDQQVWETEILPIVEKYRPKG